MTAVPDGFPKLDKATRKWECKWENETCRRKAPCPRCLGARNRRKGLRKQRAVAKEIESLSGSPVGRYSSQTGNEENWRGPFRVEVKAGQQVQRTTTQYLDARAQAEAARP